MMIAVVLILVLILAVYAFMQQPSFGKLPSGKRLEKIKTSPNYREGSFRNIHFTPMLEEGKGYTTVMKEFFFNKDKRNSPKTKLPSQKTGLLSLNKDENIIVWFGHSSYFIQVDGKKLLVDPVLSGHASPISFTTKSYQGTNRYSPEELPEIDYLFISHDHWDHLDYHTVTKLKVKKIITGLGTGAHFERWGFDPAMIIEIDWNEEARLDEGFYIHTFPARHFSGRGLTRNKSIWLSFVLITPTLKIFIGGDSGYDTHFIDIGKAYGPFDLAILECGQYNHYWKYIHMMPEETAQAALDLQAKLLLPVHWAKFSLGLHSWDEPIIRVTQACKEKNIPVIHPMIGEPVNLNHPAKTLRWWEGID